MIFAWEHPTGMLILAALVTVALVVVDVRDLAYRRR